MKLADLIKKIRYEFCVSQDEFAKELGLDQRTISDWEKDKKKLSISSLKKLATFCAKNEIEFDMAEFV